MTTQQDLMMAILSLDAYNRGYSPGMSFNNGTQTGDAKLLKDSATIPNGQSTSFYADAYKWDDQTIIAYRGTRFDGTYPGFSGPNFGDVLNGWTLSAGYAAAAQPQEAIAFYNQISSQVGASHDH